MPPGSAAPLSGSHAANGASRLARCQVRRSLRGWRRRRGRPRYWPAYLEPLRWAGMVGLAPSGTDSMMMHERGSMGMQCSSFHISSAARCAATSSAGRRSSATRTSEGATWRGGGWAGRRGGGVGRGRSRGAGGHRPSPPGRPLAGFQKGQGGPGQHLPAQRSRPGGAPACLPGVHGMASTAHHPTPNHTRQVPTCRHTPPTLLVSTTSCHTRPGQLGSSTTCGSRAMGAVEGQAGEQRHVSAWHKLPAPYARPVLRAPTQLLPPAAPPRPSPPHPAAHQRQVGGVERHVEAALRLGQRVGDEAGLLGPVGLVRRHAVPLDLRICNPGGAAQLLVVLAAADGRDGGTRWGANLRGRQAEGAQARKGVTASPSWHSAAPCTSGCSRGTGHVARSGARAAASAAAPRCISFALLLNLRRPLLLLLLLTAGQSCGG